MDHFKLDKHKALANTTMHGLSLNTIKNTWMIIMKWTMKKYELKSHKQIC